MGVYMLVLVYFFFVCAHFEFEASADFTAGRVNIITPSSEVRQAAFNADLVI